MEKIIFFLSFFLVTGSMQSQPSRFPLKENSEWRINYEEMNMDTTHMSGDEIYKYFIEGDTSIDEFNYYKLYKTGTAYYEPVFFFDKVYIGAIRDDNNKFFYIKKNTSAIEMIYNFDVKTGDTINSTIEKGMVVNSVETLNNGRRKIIFKKTNFQRGECTNWNNSYFIEGIGSMGGLFYESPCNHVGFRENCLVCYYENNNLAYKNSLSPVDCEPSNAVYSIPDDDSGFRVYPMPAKEKLMIENIKLVHAIASIEIYNLQGIKKLSERVDDNSKGNLIKVELSEFKSGIYILKINTGLTSTVIKIVKE
jgi:hypothetical protein